MTFAERQGNVAAYLGSYSFIMKKNEERNIVTLGLRNSSWFTEEAAFELFCNSRAGYCLITVVFKA
jgi:hypothetical protein